MPITNTEVHKSTLRRHDGTKWVPVYLATSSDIVTLGKELTVLGGNPGAFIEGEIVPESENVQHIIQKLLQVRVPAKYEAPTISLTVDSGNQPGTYEVGTSITATVTSKFVKNNAGDVTTHTIKKGTDEVTSGTDAIANTVITFTIGEDDVEISSACSYAQGPILQDNFEEDSPDGRIPAGAVESEPLVYKTSRNVFYGADSLGDTVPLSTSVDIRALSGTIRNAEAGTAIEIPVPANSTRVTVAYPASLPELARVEYIESGNANVVDQFIKTTSAVEGTGGYAAVAYRVYTLAWVQPIAGNMTLRAVIGTSAE